MRDPAAWARRGSLLYMSGDYKQAMKAYQHAIDLKPDYIEAHLCRATILLFFGDLKNGFEKYESRLKLGDAYCGWLSNKLKSRYWQGEEIHGKTLLVIHEGGFGDSIQFLRYISLLRHCCRVILLLPTPLNCLFANLGVPLLIDGESPIPKHDLHVSLMSLPYCFKTDLLNIPPPVKIECTLSPRKGRVGIVWKGNPKHIRDEYRSLDLAQLDPILAIPGLNFISLQKEVSVDEANHLRTYGIQTPPLHSFTDTVKILEQCELLICVDTSVGHLAASMQIPTWILISSFPDWRWLIQRTDSPWYPSAKLFRQNTLNNWAEPIQEIKKQLQGFLL